MRGRGPTSIHIKSKHRIGKRFSGSFVVAHARQRNATHGSLMRTEINCKQQTNEPYTEARFRMQKRQRCTFSHAEATKMQVFTCRSDTNARFRMQRRHRCTLSHAEATQMHAFACRSDTDARFCMQKRHRCTFSHAEATQMHAFTCTGNKGAHFHKHSCTTTERAILY